MIISVTPNPALDQTVWLERLDLGRINRTAESQLDPAGKGVNVSRMIHRLGWPTVAFGFLGGETGAIIQNSLDAEGVQHHFVHVPGRTRISMTIREPGRSTSLFGGGPSVGPQQLAALDGLLGYWLQAAKVLVLAGSLPPGFPPGTYATWIRAARARDVRVILDASGEPLRLGLATGVDLVKPNLSEAELLLGRALPDLAAQLAGAREIAALSANPATAVVLSLGDAGALCVQGGSAWRAIPPEVPDRSTVGSGDSMVAGLAVALARGAPMVEGLRLGTAAGAATAMTPGTALGTSEDVQTLLPLVSIEVLRADVSAGAGASAG
ncbi:MAG TPA: 1-phosphofructokinase family hexose kinase [Myxococcales bacterium]